MKKTRISIAILIPVFSVLFAITAFAGTFSTAWKQDASGNWYVEENGKKLKSVWLCDDAVPENGKNIWYLIDANGNMLTAGLVQDRTGNYYSLEINHNGYFGMLRYQSGTYDGINLQLESNHDGAFAAIKNQDAIDALKAKYGVAKLDFGNENCKYTSSFSKPIKSTVYTPEANWESVKKFFYDLSAKHKKTYRSVKGDSYSEELYALSDDLFLLYNVEVLHYTGIKGEWEPNYDFYMCFDNIWSDQAIAYGEFGDYICGDWFRDAEVARKEMILALLGETDGTEFFNQYKAHADKTAPGGYVGDTYLDENGWMCFAWVDAPCGNGAENETFDLSAWEGERVAQNGYKYTIRHGVYGEEDKIILYFYH